MHTTLTLYDLLLIVGLIQGIITSGFLWFSKRNRFSNRFLALAIFAFCWLTVKVLLHSLSLRSELVLRYFPIGVELLMAPALYFYIRSLVTPNFKWRPIFLLHFAPFLISQIYSIVIYIITFYEPTTDAMDVIANRWLFNPIKDMEDNLSGLSVIIYLSLSYIHLKKYRSWLKNSISDNTYPGFEWLRNLFILCSILSGFLVINLALDFFFDLQQRVFYHWQLFYLLISALIYYFGIMGFLQPQYHFELDTKVTLPKVKPPKLSIDETESIADKVKHALEVDKVFLNPTLNSKALANHLSVSQSNLSFVVNQHFKMSFRELINDYRVEAVKEKLNDPSVSHMSILGVALECGFNSEASFYRIFRKKTGMSPTEYIKS